MGTGDFYLRLGPERLAQVKKACESEGVSVSEFLRRAVDRELEGGGMPSSAARKAALAELADVAARLASGDLPALLPPSAATSAASPWDDLMNGPGL